MHDKLSLELSAATRDRLAEQAGLTGHTEAQLAALAVHVWLHWRQQQGDGIRAAILAADPAEARQSTRVEITALPADTTLRFSRSTDELPTWSYDVVDQAHPTNEPQRHLRVVRAEADEQ